MRGLQNLENYHKAIWAHFHKEVRLNVQSPQQKICLILLIILDLISYIL